MKFMMTRGKWQKRCWQKRCWQKRSWQKYYRRTYEWQASGRELPHGMEPETLPSLAQILNMSVRDLLQEAEIVRLALYLAQIDDAALIRCLHEALRGRQDVAGRRVLAAARDLAYQGHSLSLGGIAREAELDESTTAWALLRVTLLIKELEKGVPTRSTGSSGDSLPPVG